MKATIHKRKDVRGRITGYLASIGEVTADGASPKEASDKCERETLAALARLDRGPTIGRWRDHVWAVWPTTHGYSYWLDTFEGGRPGYSVSTSKVRREDAEDCALAHLAQNVWTLNVPIDDEFVVGLPSEVAKDILGWIRFQRSYAALKAQGKTDNEAHRLASRDFTTAERQAVNG